MESPSETTGWVEKRVDVRRLGRLGVALASALGESGFGGGAIADRVEACVEAVCAGCGMRVTGAELMAVALGVGGGAAGGEKLRRLGLGYCARNGCGSDYYRVRLRQVEGSDWEVLWERVEPVLRAEGVELARGGISWGAHLLALVRLAGPWARELRKPLPLAVVVLLGTGLWVRSGCRVPGISPAPRKYVVPAAVSAPRPAPAVPRGGTP
jgi:hypothetical protein